MMRTSGLEVHKLPPLPLVSHQFTGLTCVGILSRPATLATSSMKNQTQRQAHRLLQHTPDNNSLPAFLNLQHKIENDAGVFPHYLTASLHGEGTEGRQDYLQGVPEVKRCAT